MAHLNIKINEIRNNIHELSKFLNDHNIEWSLITKVFSGDKDFLKKLLTPEVISGLHSIGDSRLTSLKNLKEVNPDIVTIYIKPPAKVYAKDIINYADISLNSSFTTINALNIEAEKQNKIHKIIIMVELGELREGVDRDNLIDFYQKIFNLSNIEVIGLGSNLGCMYGVAPTYDKLLQLVLYKKLIETKFNRNLPFISGGSSITLPLITDSMIPIEVNHFRIGETAFFGTSPLNNETFLNLSSNTFDFHPYIIELEEKPLVPDGIISDASIGHTSNLEKEVPNKKTYKAILDFGLLDVDIEDLTPKDETIRFVGTTSDMTVYDLGDNEDKNNKQKYKIGDSIVFCPSYMAVARLLNSKFIARKYIE
jgi:predicted amino acid racemase